MAAPDPWRRRCHRFADGMAGVIGTRSPRSGSGATRTGQLADSRLSYDNPADSGAIPIEVSL